jgi:CubicO group peptidase (beta-lactamase class C family)
VSRFKQAFKRLDQCIEQKMKVVNLPGMAVALTDREKLLRVSTYGFADVAAQIPLTPEMLFEIGSIGKSFTSIALLQLREEGLLDLNEPVTRYLPWFEVQSAYEPITLYHLMCHTAGITMGAEFPGEARYEVWALRETEATAPSGTYYHYSDAGYKTLGVILEELLQQPYGDIIQARILDPLRMTDTVPIITNDTRNRLAVGYEGFYDDRPPPRDRPLAPATWLEHAEGAGSIASTPADMAIYLRMLMNRGQGQHGRLLSEESFDLMTQRIIETEEKGEGSFYGYGLGIRECDGHTYIGHGGGMVGYYSYILIDMDEGLGVVVLMNGPGSQSDLEIANYALKLLGAALNNQELPSVPLTDPTTIENAADYAGTFRVCTDPLSEPVKEKTPKSSAEVLTFVAEGEHLILDYGDERVILERRSPNQFYADHPDFALFVLGFGCQDGEVVELFYGPDWYINDRYTGSTTFDYPPDWDAYPGHFCSHNPWLPHFRIILRKGRLTLVHPSGEEESLVPVENGIFCVGEDDRSPERIRFDVILNGQALRANLSGGEYYRSFSL